MNTEVQNKMKEFKDYVTKLEYLNSASSVLYWDMAVNAPKKGIAYRGEVLGYLAGEAYKLGTSDKMNEYLNYFLNVEDLDDIHKSMVKNLKKEYDLSKKIPEEKFKEYTILTSQAESIWEEAYEKSDFSIFSPYLEKIVSFNREFIEYWGYKDNKYDTLLDKFEQGITVENLDNVFGELRDAIVEILNKIKKSNVQIDETVFKKNYPKDKQEEISKIIVEKMGYDFEAGRLDESTHPFTIGFNRKDVRITTDYYDDDLRPAIFSCIHEGGHAIYDQGISEELYGTGLGDGASMGIHESQSRFYENILGRSKEFWTPFYPELKRIFPEFENVSIEEFYKGMNAVQPSLIRVDADELTYSIHVIIRYEIEKALINGEIEVKDLPKIWNAKYKEYLGVEPSNDAEGVLQDNHWAGGAIGYFPSYALGNLYGAQFLNKMKQDIPNVFEEMEKGNLEIIHQWLKENIHKYGAVYTPAELIKKVTGEELTAKYFIEYLNEKYTRIYNL
jgi:carboxypeptidase Taq